MFAIHRRHHQAIKFVQFALCLSMLAVVWPWLEAKNEQLWLDVGGETLQRYEAERKWSGLPAIPRQADLLVLCDAAEVPRVEQPWLQRLLPLPRWQRERTAECVNAAMQTAPPASIAVASRSLASSAQDHIAEQLRALNDRQVRYPIAVRAAAIETAQQRHASLAADLATNGSSGTAAAVRIALFARGLHLDIDFGHTPPKPRLVADPRSPADLVERARRAQVLASALTGNDTLKRLLPAVMLGMAALVIVGSLTRYAALPMVLVWMAVSSGALLLLDIALHGDGTFRHLVVRQFAMWPGLAEHAALFDLGLVHTQGAWPAFDAWMAQHSVWLPPVALASMWLFLKLILRFAPIVLAPVELWVIASNRSWVSIGQSLLLVVAAVAIIVLLGLPAAASDALILIACIGLATYTVRNAALRTTVRSWDAAGLVTVAAASMAAVGGSLARGDLGHALLAFALGGFFIVLFGGAVWRGLVLLAGASAILAIYCYRAAFNPVASWVTEAVNLLPPHAQDRFFALREPFSVSTSDLARVRWLIRSAESNGWGVGNVPWSGIDVHGVGTAVPLQAPSDYAIALLAAQWGLPVATGVVVAMLATLLLATARGLRIGFDADRSLASRWLAVVGAFGCLAVALKAVLSTAGVLGVLPLTGLPVAFVGYGPVNLWAAVVYVILATGVADRDRSVYHGTSRPCSPLALAGGAFSLAALVASASLVVYGAWQCTVQPVEAVHTARARHDAARRIAEAIIPVARDATQPGNHICPELRVVGAAWADYLNAMAAAAAPAVAPSSDHPVRWQLDLPHLLAGDDCVHVARDAGQVLAMDRSRIRRSSESRTSTFAVRVDDFVTPNRWWGLPGCVRWLDQTPLESAANRHCVARKSVSPAPQQPIVSPADRPTIADAWLRNEIVAHALRAQREAPGDTQFQGKTIRAGRDVTLTIDPAIQAVADQLVRCYTATAGDKSCTSFLPRDAAWAKRYFGAGKLRAGAAGVVVVDATDGAIRAVSGAISDCSRGALATPAELQRDGSARVLSGALPCSQFPDQRNRWLLSQSPALWQVPPGSALKGLVALAGIQAGSIGATNEAQWRDILAESHDQTSVQRVALAHFGSYHGVLSKLGFDASQFDVFWGNGKGGAPLVVPSLVHWSLPLGSGAELLRTPGLGFDQVQRIRAEKEAGVNVDAKYGVATVQSYLAARRVLDTAVGGGDLRTSTLGLANAFVQLERARDGAASGRSLHLAQPSGAPIESTRASTATPPIASRNAAERTLRLLTGVTAAAHRGTAAGSCRVVFGACPANGLPSLAGKTGTADFAVTEDSPLVKAGQQIPSKVFAAVFTSGGRRYVIASMVLRVRDGVSDRLELQSNAAAELALTLIREQLPVDSMR